MSYSQASTKSIISDIIRDYTNCLVYNYEIFKEARKDFKNHNITVKQLTHIMIILVLKISRKYRQISNSIEINKMKQFRLDVYTDFANFIKYVDDKSIEIEDYNTETKVINDLLSSMINTIDLYLKDLNQMVINEKKLENPNKNKKSCNLCLKMPSQSINEGWLEKSSPKINDQGFIYYEISSDRDLVDSKNSSFTFHVDSRPSSICMDAVPSYSPVEGLSPATSDTEDELPQNRPIDQLIPDWKDFLNDCLFKWYVMGGEKPTTGCLENMHLFLGGRRLSNLHTPSPSKENSPQIENGPVVFRRRPENNLTPNEVELSNLLAELNVDKYIVFKILEGNCIVQYAEVDALIVYATEHLDSEFCDTFVSTHQSFINADELIEKLVFRFNKFLNQRGNQTKSSFTLITKISKVSSRHSITTSLLTSLVNFVHRLVVLTEIEWAIELRQIFIEKLNEYHKFQTLMNAIPEYLGDECVESLLHFKPILLAQQMTLIAYELFTKIEIPELLVSETKSDTPNVTAFIHHCDKLSYWITTIIGKLQSSRDVQKHVKYLVNVMKYLKEYRDYSSCWAILGGLQNAYIYKVTKKYEHYFSEFEELFAFSSNYKNYRNLLKESKLPRIPLICIALHDLIYISEATKRFKPVELTNSINFYRIWRQYKYIKVFKEEKCGYPFKKNSKVLTFFRNFDNNISDNKSS